MINLSVNGVRVELNTIHFSDSAQVTSLTSQLPVNPVVAKITAICTGDIADNLFNIGCLVNILRNINSRMRIFLFMPYLPHARQDRRMSTHDAFSLQVFAKLLNSYQLDGVMVADPHSDVGPSLINNCVIIPQEVCVELSLRGHKYGGIVAPDAGSMKKIHKAAKALDIDNIVVMDKVRDVTTGAITATALLSDPANVAGRDLLIVDDICDGGRTFIEVANVLRQVGAQSVDLYVTHGIFARGVVQVLDGGIDHITCTSSVQLPTLTAVKDTEMRIDVNSISRVADRLFPNWGER